MCVKKSHTKSRPKTSHFQFFVELTVEILPGNGKPGFVCIKSRNLVGTKSGVSNKTSPSLKPDKDLSGPVILVLDGKMGEKERYCIPELFVPWFVKTGQKKYKNTIAKARLSH